MNSHGWNLVAELDGFNARSVVRTYVWGADLSGSKQGAGGVGGLLLVRSHFRADDGSQSGTRYQVHSDANGNVMSLLALDGANAKRVVGRFDYDAFGNRITNTLPPELGDVCPVGFSSKFTDKETGHVYYGYRILIPELGRWANRDPLKEEGGANLYHLNFNDCIGQIDADGLLSTGSASPSGAAALAFVAAESGTMSSGGAGLTATVAATPQVAVPSMSQVVNGLLMRLGILSPALVAPFTNPTPPPAPAPTPPPKTKPNKPKPKEEENKHWGALHAHRCDLKEKRIVTWGQEFPPSKAWGVISLRRLKEGLKPSIQRDLKKGFEEAEKAILKGPLPAGFIRGYPRNSGDNHVDIEVWKGWAFD